MDYYLNNNYFFITNHTLFQDKRFKTKEQKQLVKDQLLKTAEHYNFKYIAYSVLSNHFHLLFKLKKGELLKNITSMIKGGISFNYNKLYPENRIIWGDYHNSNVFGEDSFYRVIGYVVGNPFKHRLVQNIKELENYEFCNYNELAKIYGKKGINEIISKVANLNWKF